MATTTRCASCGRPLTRHAHSTKKHPEWARIRCHPTQNATQRLVVKRPW